MSGPQSAPPTRVAVVVGTRPEAVKLAPMVHALDAAPDFEPVLGAAAQHRDMLDPVLDFFGLVAQHDLDVFSPGQTLTDVATPVMTRLDDVYGHVERIVRALHHRWRGGPPAAEWDWTPPGDAPL